MRLSEKLQMLRKQAGLSQEQLAERLNVTRQAVSKWETGESKPDIDNLLPLSRILNTTIDYLLDDTEEPQSAPQYRQSAQQPESDDWWSQIKAFFRRYGFIGGYLLALIGAARLVNSVIMLAAAGGMLGTFTSMDMGLAVGFGVPYYLICIVQIAVNAALIAAGLWLAKWLRRKYAE